MSLDYSYYILSTLSAPGYSNLNIHIPGILIEERVMSFGSIMDKKNEVQTHIFSSKSRLCVGTFTPFIIKQEDFFEFGLKYF